MNMQTKLGLLLGLCLLNSTLYPMSRQKMSCGQLVKAAFIGTLAVISGASSQGNPADWKYEHCVNEQLTLQDWQTCRLTNDCQEIWGYQQKEACPLEWDINEAKLNLYLQKFVGDPDRRKNQKKLKKD